LSLALHLRIAGVLLLLLAAVHLVLPRKLGWREDLAKLTLLNRQIFRVHVAFLMLTLILFGLLALLYTADLLAPSRLATAVLCGLTLFWGARLLTQHLVYDASLWRGHRRNTIVHLLATLLWLYFTVVFGWGWWRQVTVR
jgi:hypothetical protein